MVKQHNAPLILDCTIRDGGYVNNWRFDKKMVREVYRALSKSGMDYVELGFRGTEKNFDPKVYGLWRFSTEENLREVTEGIEGARIAIMGDYGKIAVEDFDDRKNSIIDLVRIAVNRDKVFGAIDLLGKIKSKGYLTSLQAMGFTSYTDNEKVNLKSALKNSDIDYFYIADSYGSIFPNEIPSLFEPFLDLKPMKIGFHPHNSLQMAFANTLEAIKIGADIVDSSIFGMGRGSGNLPTEILIAYLQKGENKRYNVIPVLNCIERFFVDINKEMPWGYELPYLISGMFRCHPYYASELVKRREYSIEDIWKTLETIEELKPIGFDLRILENLIQHGFVGPVMFNNDKKKEQDEALNVSIGGRKEHVPYINRHKGKDFLILANGPTLKEYQPQIRSFINKHEPIILGANYLADLFIPHYHAFNNKKRFTMYADSVHKQSKLLVGENIPNVLIKEYLDRDFETLYFDDVLEADFGIQNGRILCNCRTISVLLLGVAIVMGARRLFVAGMDGYLSKNSATLFYDEKFDPVEYEVNAQRHRWNDHFLRQIDQYLQAMGLDGVHIITPTSHQTFYKGIENYL